MVTRTTTFDFARGLEILDAMYGEDERLRQAEVGALFGISSQRVGQIEERMARVLLHYPLSPEAEIMRSTLPKASIEALSVIYKRRDILVGAPERTSQLRFVAGLCVVCGAPEQIRPAYPVCRLCSSIREEAKHV